MKEYTAKEMKLLKANPYTFKVTKNKLYFTVEFKEAFWTAYQAGMAPRKILEDLGYDLEMFGQKQIDSIVQRIKHQAQDGRGFRQGENRTRRKKDNLSIPEGTSIESKETLTRILNGVIDGKTGQYSREVLGKIPFEVSADPFYSESNMAHLRRGADAPGAGKGAEHDIIEADE